MISTCENFDKIAKWYSKQWQKVPVSMINLYTWQKSWRSQTVNRQWMEIWILRRHFEWQRRPRSTVFTWPRGWQSSIFTCPQRQAIFNLHLTTAIFNLHLSTAIFNLQSSPDHRDRRSTVFTWPWGQTIFNLHLSTGTGSLQSSPDHSNLQSSSDHKDRQSSPHLTKRQLSLPCIKPFLIPSLHRQFG